MPQDKRPLGLIKPKAKSDNTKVSKIVKDPKVGPNYSEFNKPGIFEVSKTNAKDSLDYQRGYRMGASNAISGNLTRIDKKGNPTLAYFPYGGQGPSSIREINIGAPRETMRYAEGRLEGEKRYFKSKENKSKKK